jgi:predicted HTH domain antitoxin
VQLKTLAIRYPESFLATLNLSPETFEQEAKTALAVKLYELGRLTSGQAAELAGIPRVAFLLSCQHYGAATVEWDQKELGAEFSDMGQ